MMRMSNMIDEVRCDEDNWTLFISLRPPFRVEQVQNVIGPKGVWIETSNNCAT